MKSQKGAILTIVIIIVLAVIVAGGYLVYKKNLAPEKSRTGTSTGTPTPSVSSIPTDQTNGSALSEVEGWKTYTNTQYGFEIKYPPDVKIGNLIDVVRGKSITFQITSDKLLEILISSQNPRCPYDRASGVETTNVVFNGANFIKQDVSKSFSINLPYAVADAYCIVKGNVEYELIPRIYYYSDASGNHVLPDLENDLILNQILSTFKFTK